MLPIYLSIFACAWLSQQHRHTTTHQIVTVYFVCTSKELLVGSPAQENAETVAKLCWCETPITLHASYATSYFADSTNWAIAGHCTYYSFSLLFFMSGRL